MLFFFIIPLVNSLIYSFTNFNLTRMKFVGWRNYVEMFTDDRHFTAACRVTLKYVVFAVPIRMVVSLAVAMMLNKDIKGLRVYRALYYVPSLLGGSVAISLLWMQLFGSKGIFNNVLAAFGANVAGKSWITDPNTSLSTLIVLAIWQFGSSMIVFLAGIKQVPAQLYEAAAIDGASPAQSFFRITLPLISPIIEFNLIMEVINAFQAFTPAFIITNGTGGTLDSVLFYTLYMYRVGFNQMQMGYSAAMAWVLLITIGIVTAIIFSLSRKFFNYD